MVTDSDPSPLMNVKVTHLGHELGAIEDQKYYDIDPADWPFPGKSYADDFVEMSSHAGTHMDAPYHFGPQTIPGGERPKYIDRVAAGVVLRPRRRARHPWPARRLRGEPRRRWSRSSRRWTTTSSPATSSWS